MQWILASCSTVQDGTAILPAELVPPAPKQDDVTNVILQIEEATKDLETFVRTDGARPRREGSGSRVRPPFTLGV